MDVLEAASKWVEAKRDFVRADARAKYAEGEAQTAKRNRDAAESHLCSAQRELDSIIASEVANEIPF